MSKDKHVWMALGNTNFVLIIIVTKFYCLNLGAKFDSNRKKNPITKTSLSTKTNLACEVLVILILGIEQFLWKFTDSSFIWKFHREHQAV